MSSDLSSIFVAGERNKKGAGDCLEALVLWHILVHSRADVAWTGRDLADERRAVTMSSFPEISEGTLSQEWQGLAHLDYNRNLPRNPLSNISPLL